MNLDKVPLFIGCDWGSSNFRMALLTASGIPCSEYADGGGIVTLRTNGTDTNGLVEHLRQGLSRLEATVGGSLETYPLFISGMAGSSIGIVEVPYAPVPFSVDGSDAVVHGPSMLDGIPNRVRIVSGVCTPEDVMRGEETEAMGLMSMLGMDAALLILPGTHSKHIEISAGRIRSFRTYMTGEIFRVISGQTILARSMTDSGGDTFDPDDRRCFIEGVELSGRKDLLHSLFTLRSRTLLEGMPVKGNIHRLSGLLIGEELRSIHNLPEFPVILGGSGVLHELYKTALELILPGLKVPDMTGLLYTQAVWCGQAVFNRDAEPY